MAYKLNPDIWNSVFAIPTSIVDEHLRRSSGQQLKVLLYLFRHNGQNPDASAIGTGVGMSASDVEDALQYWVETGYVYKDGTAPTPVVSAEKKPLTEIPDVTPTYEQVAARTLEDPIIKGLFNEAQTRLGKTIGYDTQAKLLMMIDSYGLPPEVILTIIEYAVSHGKNSISYICKVGKNWAEDGIDSLEAAEERLKALDKQEKLWNQFSRMFSASEAPKPTASRIAFVKKWRGEWKQSNELLYLAYEETINKINQLNFKYMDRILESWHEQGLKTPQAVLQSKKGQPAPATPTTTGTTSYDSDAFKKKARGPIEYKPKG